MIRPFNFFQRAIFYTMLVSVIACDTSKTQMVKNQSHEQVVEQIETVALSKILKRIEPALVELKSKARNNNLKIDSVTLNFNTASTSEKGGELSLLVFKAGTRMGSSMTSEYTIKLTEIKEQSEQTTDRITVFFQNLNAIVEQSAISIARLGTSEVTGTLKFVIQRTHSGGIGGLEIKPITVSLSGSINDSYAQSITVVLKRMEDTGDAV